MIKRNEEREKFLFVMLILAIGFTSVIFCAIPNEIKYRSALEAVQAPIQREVSKLTLNSSWSFGTKAVSGCQLKNASTSRESCFDIMYVPLLFNGVKVKNSVAVCERRQGTMSYKCSVPQVVKVENS